MKAVSLSSLIKMSSFHKFSITISLLAVVVGILFPATLTNAAYQYPEGEKHQVPIHLDETIFPKAINDPANPFWFLKFYAPWCGHCVRYIYIHVT